MFVIFVTVLILIFTTVFFLLPLNARVWFQHRVAVLRDECLDPAYFSLARALASHRAVVELGCERRWTKPAYGSLGPGEREILRSLDEQLVEEFAKRLVRGSAFGWLLWLLTAHWRTASVPEPRHLAREGLGVSQRLSVQGRPRMA
jgi:hypothetical protein